MLYFRMFITMAVGLYSSRIVLNVLGVQDFGIYNIIGGVTISFAIFSDSLTGATNRFLTFALGKNDLQQYNKIFSLSLLLYISLIIVFIFFFETLGLWLVNTQLNIPVSRIGAANWVYQLSILYFLINVLRIPYDASIIAHERMSFYAYLSLFEVSLKLLYIIFLQYTHDVDKLILYSVFVDIASFILFIIYFIYCNTSFIQCRFKYYWNTTLFKQLAGFSGWSLTSSATAMTSNQGIDFLLNRFGGVTVNAAMGVANQVSAVVNSFVLNFQTAFKPPIIKYYAAEDNESLLALIFRSAKFSFFLLMLPSIPLLLELETVLRLWLGIVPHFSANYCRFVLIALLFETLSGPLWMLVQAHGKIKKYEIVTSFVFFMNFVVTLIFLSLKVNIGLCIIARDIVYGTLLFTRLYLLKELIHFPAVRFVKKVVIRCWTIALLSLTIPFVFHYILPQEGFVKLLLISAISVISSIIFIFLLGLEKSEKKVLLNLIGRKYGIKQ